MSNSRLPVYLLIFCSLILFGLLLTINRGLAGLAADFFPSSSPWVLLGLFALEGLALLWFWRGLFGRRQYLVICKNPTSAELTAFNIELARRLRHNSYLDEALRKRLTQEAANNLEHLKADHLPAPLAACLQDCLQALGQKADEEIKNAAKRVFLGTALSQNGRLDGLVVFVSLCRLIWRVSAIYNQRPHPRELLSLYAAVASSTFLALSLEELNLTTEITVGFSDTLQANVPAAATSSMPFVGAALQTFTASAIDGTANCYLTLRAGIIARNAYAYSLHEQERPSRAAVFREAGCMLMALSGGLLERLARSVGAALGSGISGLAKSIGGGISNSVSGAASGSLNSLGRLAKATTTQTGNIVVVGVKLTGQAMKTTGDTVVKIGNSAGEAVMKAGSSTGDVMLKIGSATGNAVVKVGSATGNTIAKVGNATGNAVLKAGNATGNIILQTGRGLSAPFRKNKE